jgi:hypothetical protein
MTPANIGQPRQPARSTALRITGGDPGAVQRFVETLLRRQKLHQMEDTGHRSALMMPQLPIELLPRGQAGKDWPQVALRIAVKAVLTA